MLEPCAPPCFSPLTPRHAFSLSAIHSSHIPQQPTIAHSVALLLPSSTTVCTWPRCVVGSLYLANSNGSTPPLSQSPNHTTPPPPYYYDVHTTRVPPSCIIATTSNEITHDINLLHCHDTGVALEPCTPHCFPLSRHATPSHHLTTRRLRPSLLLLLLLAIRTRWCREHTSDATL